MNIAILGFGREGKSLLKYLRSRGSTRITTPRFRSGQARPPAGRQGLTRKNDVWILDKNENIKIPKGIKSQLGKHFLKNLERFDIIFRSPGVPWNLPELRRARENGVEFSSATRLFFEEIAAMVRRGSPQVIGVTGTKGKGTTATLIYKILKAAGKDAHLAGNIGKSPLMTLPKLTRRSVVVLELSSFQLQDLGRSPHIAVVLDVFPDHQDAHLNLKEYYEAKTNIARHQKKTDKIFFFKNHPLSRWVAAKSRARKYPVLENRFALFAPEDLKTKGFHNFKNAVMAAEVARALKIPHATILKAIRKFRGLPHRLEFIRSIPYSQVLKNMRISFYNDSASTNPHTTAAAIRAFPNAPTVLIAGGQDKGLNYAPLARALKHSTVKLVVLFGENKHKIAKTIKKTGVQLRLANNLHSAVKIATRFAVRGRARYSLPPIIIFSPGAASFDMFKNYADRGNKFKKIVKNLKAR